MSNLWLKTKVWTKVVLFGLMLIYLGCFIVNNSQKTVQPWYWFEFLGSGPPADTSVLTLIFVAFVSGILVTLLIRTTLTTLKQYREMQTRNRTQRLEREITEMKTKAAMVRTVPGPEPADPGAGGSGAP